MIHKNKFVWALFFWLGAVAYGGNPIIIGSTTYVPGTTTESLSTPFTSITGQATANAYSGYVLVNVSGTGQSAGAAYNDAFYVLGSGSPSHDPSYYQIRYSTAPMSAFEPQFDAYNFIVYDAIAGTQVNFPYVPAYQASNTYSFVLPVPGGGPSVLYFGVSDGDYSDNTGSYSITVTQLQASEMTTAFAPTPGVSTNMVSGTQWPGGDPFLQRQNEPSMAVSSRNPMHVVAGDNDYRTVDLPFVTGAEETGDAWLGFFTSYDGGQTWTSVLVPGYPQDVSAQGASSPLHGLNAGADPGVRAGPNGMFLYSGLAFDRDESASSVFVARYVDDNNNESGNTVRYLDTHVIAQGSETNNNSFLDKPAIAVDIPRGTNTCTITGPGGNAETIPAFNVYVAYTLFYGSESVANPSAQIMLSQSQDCGVTWSAPMNVSNPYGEGGAYTNQGAQIAIDPNTGTVFVFWRIFADPATGDSNAVTGQAYPLSGNAVSQSNFQSAGYFLINSFDQGTSDYSFRTNAYPAIAADDHSNLYVAWSQRGLAPNGDAQIAMKVLNFGYGANGVYLNDESAQITVDPYNGPGHQIMPALAYSAGKLTAAWYDFRDDDAEFLYTPLSTPGEYSFILEPLATPIFQTQIVDPPEDGGTLRHTVDVRAAQAPSAGLGGNTVSFQPSVLVSQYAYGSPAPASSSSPIEQLEFDAPNLPLFEGGTVPFVGDYIDVAGPTFISNSSGAWRYNTLPTDPDNTHIVWTDNRNVIAPANGNWQDYTAVGLTAGAVSIYDSTQTIPQSCTVGQTGMRNQDIYTASLSPGVIMGAMGNTKPLSTTLQREFSVTVQNTASQAASYRLTITSQPVGGTASFLQSSGPALTQLDITIPPLSSASRSLYLTSSNPAASVLVTAQQINMPGGVLVSNGLNASVTLNPDISNPNISNPNISNPNISNPNISNAEVYNPNISNPNISNPNISNPNISNPNISNPNISNITIANPNISNPNISNPNISNPNISNPNISNPNISNPNISNAALTDANYIVTNYGNTTTSYNVQLLQNQPTPNMVEVQLIVSGIYTTPVANSCTLDVEAHYVPILNVTNPALLNTVNTPSTSTPPDPNSYTVVLAPGEQIMVTVRAYDFTTNNDAAALAHYNPGTAISPVIVSTAVSTGSTTPSVSLTITSTAMNLTSATEGTMYSQSLQAIGGSGAGYQWSSNSLPPGLNLTPGGTLQGTPSTSGSYTFQVQVTDSAQNTTAKTLTLTIYQTPVAQLTGPSSAVYGSSFPVTPQITSGDTATATIMASGPCQITGASVQMTAGSGTCQLTANWPASGFFTAGTAVLPVTATKATLTVTANSPAPINFGQAIPAFTASYTGFVSPDTQSVLTGSPSLTTTATQYSAPGTYSIVAGPGTLAAANYSFTFVNGTLTINSTGSVPASGTACNGAYTGAFSGNITVSAGQICELDGGSVSGNLTSTGGIVILMNATVSGNLQISGTATGAGASLEHQVCGSQVKGNVQFQTDHNPLVMGGAQGTSCGPVTVNGNLQVLSNSASTTMSYVTVSGSLQAESNSAPVSVTYDKVQGAIQVQSNSSTVSVANDTTQGAMQVQSNTSSVAVTANTVTGALQVQDNKSTVTVTGNTVTGALQVESNTGPSTTVSNNTVTSTLQCSGNTTITGSGNKAQTKQGQCATF